MAAVYTTLSAMQAKPTVSAAREVKPEKETIHSGHFMVSHFEADAQDDEDDVAVPIPDTETKLPLEILRTRYIMQTAGGPRDNGHIQNQQLSIDTSLSKLFQCMSLAYRQKLTSPKWNRFRGIKLRWKDKIRLNNVIWRCWHLQFVKKQNTVVCQFASPLDVDTHSKPEAIVLEGKYWKRKLAAVTAEYKKWRLFYRNRFLGFASKDCADVLQDADMLDWSSKSNDGSLMMVDEDYMELMTDTLFSTITNQPFAFPDSREIAKAGLADFIQPSLGPLQPNLDDFMDTLEPLQEFFYSKLPPVPEENQQDNSYNKQASWCYSDLDLMAPNSNMQLNASMQNTVPSMVPHYQNVKLEKPPVRQNLTNYSDVIIGVPLSDSYTNQREVLNISMPSHIPKPQMKTAVQMQPQVKISQAQTQPQPLMYKQTVNNTYQNYPIMEMSKNIIGNISTVQGSSMQPSVPAFKIPQAEPTSQSQPYRFTATVQPNMKFTQQLPHMSSGQSQLMIPTKDGIKSVEAPPLCRSKGVQNQRQRSRSTSREPLQRPPLLSAVSDPALITPSTSVLLTQLIANNNQENMYLRTNSSQSVNTASVDSSNTVLVKNEENQPVSILTAQSAAGTALLIAGPVTMSASQSASPGDQLMLSSMNAQNSSVMDPGGHGVGSPGSPGGSMLGSPGKGDCGPPRDQRRAGHIHAEQKRRYNIKNGFDMIHSLIPQLNQNPNAKLSKAAMLQKGAEYIRQLRSERNQLKEEMDSLRQQIEYLNTSISNCQSLLPATGAPVSRRRDSKMQEMFDRYVRSRTMENWKFWIFSLLIEPLLVSYNNFVSTSSLDELYRTTLSWVEQHCTLVELRPVVLNSLRYLCTKTDILTEPERLPEEIKKAVTASKQS